MMKRPTKKLNQIQITQKKVKALITGNKPSLTYSKYKFLIHNYFETSNFYGRPKMKKLKVLHKATKKQNKEVITISEPKNLNLRPKVGETKCPNIRLSNFFDLILKLLTKHPKRNARFTTKFILEAASLF